MIDTQIDDRPPSRMCRTDQERKRASRLSTVAAFSARRIAIHLGEHLPEAPDPFYEDEEEDMTPS